MHLDQALDDDEMLEIAEFGLPMKWQKAMVEHDFDCSQKTIDQIIDFAERQETIESLEQGLYDGDNHPAKKAKKAPEQAAPYKTKGGLPGRAKSSYEARRHASSNSGRNSKANCRLHGPGHATEDCKVLMDQADRMKATRAAQHSSTYNNNQPRTKRSYGNNYSKEEVNKIVGLAMKKAVAKAMGNNASTVSSGATPQELNKFDELKISDIDSDEDFETSLKIWTVLRFQ